MRSPIKKLLASIGQAKADHAVRHRTTGFEFAIADRIDLLHPDHWDAVTQDATFFLSRDYLRLFENSGPSEISPRYCLIAERGQPLGVVAAQMVVLEGEQLVGQQRSQPTASEKRNIRAMSKRLLGNIGHSTLSHVRRRVLVCGNLLSWGAHGFAMRANEEPARLWPAIAEALYRIRNAEKLVGKTDYVMVKDLPSNLAIDAKSLAQFSYRSVATDPDMVLEIPATWQSYDDYLQSLNAKYRKTAKALDTDLLKAGLRVEPLLDLSSEAESLHALYGQVQAKAKVRLASVPATYLPALAELAGPDRFRCSVVRRDGELLGFVTTLKDGDTAIGYYIGFDYETNATAPVYLRLLQAVVADSISLGCRRVSLGRTALEPKARLGAKPMPMTVWMRHRLPLLNLVVRPLLSAIPHDEPPERSVFKESS
ncbi:MAG: GNAT family N-acetyltransferase [Planctomycetaceae bacterium]